MNYANIKNCDIANGPGVRVSLFVSGCRHTKAPEAEILELLKPDYIQGFTLLGGEPFEPENQVELVHLLKKIRETYPKKSIWCYTGYLYDVDLIPDGKVFTDATEKMLSYIDILVDGEFVQAEKDLSLQFRGSRNQRILKIGDHADFEPQ